MALLALALPLGVVTCGGTDHAPTSKPTTPTPSATATPPSTTPPSSPAVATVDGVEVLPLQAGDEAEVPDEVALIVETGCTGCDGPTTGFLRVYRDGGGELRTDTLFRAHENTLADPGPFITSFALVSNASEIVVGVCATPDKCAWLGNAAADARTILYRSLDGGMTWAEYGVLDGDYRVLAIAEDGVVLVGPLATEEGAARPPYQLFPSGDRLDPPSGAGEGWPLSLPSGQLLWLAADNRRLLRSDGREFLLPNLGEDARLHFWGLAPAPDGQRVAISWYTTASPSVQGREYFGVADLGGRLLKAFSLIGYATLGGWLDSEVVLGNGWVSRDQSPLPVIFDVDAGRMRPISRPFLEPPLLNGRNRIVAVIRGPFARVVGTGSCLKVRADPGLGSPVLTCATDGVLLRDVGETQEVEAVTWRRVVTPAGVEGWASATYLQR